MIKSWFRPYPIPTIVKVISILYLWSSIKALIWLITHLNAQYKVFGVQFEGISFYLWTIAWIALDGGIAIGVWRGKILGFYLGIVMYLVSVISLGLYLFYPSLSEIFLSQMQHPGFSPFGTTYVVVGAFFVWWLTAIGALWKEASIIRQK